MLRLFTEPVGLRCTRVGLAGLAGYIPNSGCPVGLHPVRFKFLEILLRPLRAIFAEMPEGLRRRTAIPHIVTIDQP